MSFILNALRKSELERQSAQAQTLGDRILEKQPIEKKKNNLFWWVVLVAANVFFMAYFFMSTYEKETKSVEQDVLLIPENVGAKKTIDSQLLKKDLKKQSTIAQLLGKQRMKSEEIEKQKIQKIKKADRMVQKRKAVKKKIAAEKAKSVVRARPKAIVKAVPIKKLVAKKEILKKPTLISTSKPVIKAKKDSGPPFLSELPYDFRRTVPSIRINVYVYSDNKDERFIMVNMKKYQSGEEIGEGIMLKDIQKDSFVVEYEGRVFRIKR